MAYQIVTLTQNNQYFALAGNQGKATFHISKASIFGGASLIETRTFKKLDDTLDFVNESPMIDTNGQQITISIAGQITREAPDKDLYYVWKLQNATGTTSIKICYSYYDQAEYSSNATYETL